MLATMNHIPQTPSTATAATTTATTTERKNDAVEDWSGSENFDDSIDMIEVFEEEEGFEDLPEDDDIDDDTTRHEHSTIRQNSEKMLKYGLELNLSSHHNSNHQSTSTHSLSLDQIIADEKAKINNAAATNAKSSSTRRSRKTGSSNKRVDKEWGNASTPTTTTFRDIISDRSVHKEKSSRSAHTTTTASMAGQGKSVENRIHQSKVLASSASRQKVKAQKKERRNEVKNSLAHFLSANRPDSEDDIDDEDEDDSLISDEDAATCNQNSASNINLESKEDEDEALNSDGGKSIGDKSARSTSRRRRRHHRKGGAVAPDDGTVGSTNNSKRRSRRRDKPDDATVGSRRSRRGRRRDVEGEEGAGAANSRRSRRTVDGKKEQSEETTRRKKTTSSSKDISDDRSVGSKRSVGRRRRLKESDQGKRRRSRERRGTKPSSSTSHADDANPAAENSKEDAHSLSPTTRSATNTTIRDESFSKLSNHNPVHPPTTETSLSNHNENATERSASGKNKDNEERSQVSLADSDDTSDESSQYSSVDYQETLLQFDPSNECGVTAVRQDGAQIHSDTFKHADGTESELQIRALAGLPTFEGGPYSSQGSGMDIAEVLKAEGHDGTADTEDDASVISESMAEQLVMNTLRDSGLLEGATGTISNEQQQQNEENTTGTIPLDQTNNNNDNRPKNLVKSKSGRFQSFLSKRNKESSSTSANNASRKSFSFLASKKKNTRRGGAGDKPDTDSDSEQKARFGRKKKTHKVLKHQALDDDDCSASECE